MADLCVTKVPIFQGLSRQQQEHVASFIRPASFSRGETVSSPEQSVPRLLVMHSGQLKVSRLAANGKEQVLRIVGPGDVVGERAFLTGERQEDLVMAVADSRMCVLEHKDLAALIREYPGIGMRMLRSLSDRLTSMESRLASLTTSDVAARIAGYLLDQPAESRNGRDVVRLPMSKREVASYLGTSPETLSRGLARLSESGMIEVSGQEIVLLDIAELDRIDRQARTDVQA
ncbi:Crp/Fnr family transcriptional regulator [Ancrocorticia populi]|uniref:Crp/Fnr family transcriptional regulator n=1 Tax=Ancrocorticia populi TaxID=2175228 RepID=A0A2V1KAI1_9ACTO|nr:Crp/Fnr family transcriptional regulator [Ancrocorticia populi]PWF27320.1 Crp/Fnr family transcriptional regulator [Ancrocorticia populi]